MGRTSLHSQETGSGQPDAGAPCTSDAECAAGELCLPDGNGQPICTPFDSSGINAGRGGFGKECTQDNECAAGLRCLYWTAACQQATGICSECPRSFDGGLDQFVCDCQGNQHPATCVDFPWSNHTTQARGCGGGTDAGAGADTGN